MRRAASDMPPSTPTISVSMAVSTGRRTQKPGRFKPPPPRPSSRGTTRGVTSSPRVREGVDDHAVLEHLLAEHDDVAGDLRREDLHAVAGGHAQLDGDLLDRAALADDEDGVGVVPPDHRVPAGPRRRRRGSRGRSAGGRTCPAAGGRRGWRRPPPRGPAARWRRSSGRAGRPGRRRPGRGYASVVRSTRWPTDRPAKSACVAEKDRPQRVQLHQPHQLVAGAHRVALLHADLGHAAGLAAAGEPRGHRAVGAADPGDPGVGLGGEPPGLGHLHRGGGGEPPGLGGVGLGVAGEPLAAELGARGRPPARRWPRRRWPRTRSPWRRPGRHRPASTACSSSSGSSRTSACPRSTSSPSRTPTSDHPAAHQRRRGEDRRRFQRPAEAAAAGERPDLDRGDDHRRGRSSAAAPPPRRAGTRRWCR